jgi:hypothetical protein
MPLAVWGWHAPRSLGVARPSSLPSVTAVGTPLLAVLQPTPSSAISATLDHRGLARPWARLPHSRPSRALWLWGREAFPRASLPEPEAYRPQEDIEESLTG